MWKLGGKHRLKLPHNFRLAQHKEQEQRAGNAPYQDAHNKDDVQERKNERSKQHPSYQRGDAVTNAAAHTASRAQFRPR